MLLLDGDKTQHLWVHLGVNLSRTYFVSAEACWRSEKEIYGLDDFELF